MKSSSFLLPKNSENIEKSVAIGVQSRAAHQRPVLLDIQDINRASKRKPKPTRSEPIYAIAKYLKHTVEVWVFDIPMLPQEELSKGIIKPRPVNFPDETNDERSLRRTKQTISDLIKCNDFELFCTFTFDPEKVDRTNMEDVSSVMNTWLKHQKRNSPDFMYLAVTEFHKDGKSIHFHILIKGYRGKLVLADIKQQKRRTFNIVGFRSGFTTAVEMDDNFQAVSFYIQKYITKDMPKFKNKHRYWASYNLAQPLIQYNPSEWIAEHEHEFAYSNDYGIKLIFDKEKIKSVPEVSLL